MSVFFDGQLLITPTTASVVDDTGLANQNLTVGNNVALIGRSEGGQPNTPLRFGSPSEAQAVLRSGELLTAVLKAFDPSNQTGGPAQVIAVRVNPATQASLVLNNSVPAAVITLTSTDYGLHTNQIKVKIEAGSSAGKKLTVQMGNAYYSADNVARNAFKVRYSGAEVTGVMTINQNSVVLQAPSGTTVATIDLNVYNTVEKLVDRINSVSGFAASVEDGNATKTVLNGLDYITGQDVKTADYVAKADLQAIVDWFNGVGEGFVNATRGATAGTLPANIGFTYLAGGSDGSVTNTEWSNAYTTLQSVDVQWVVPITSDAAIHAMNDAHCKFMSTVGKSERRGIVGTASGTTDSAAITAAKALNSDRTSLVHIGFKDYDINDVNSSELVLFPPYILAALLAGAFAGVNPGTPLTNKSIKVRGLERRLRNPVDTDLLIQGGVLCVEETNNGFKVVQSISTWLTDDNYNRVEVSTGVAVDFVCRNVREALDVLRGEKAGPLILSRAVSITESRLRELARPEPTGPGVIQGDAANPAYRNISATVQGDVLRVQFECQPAIGVNFVLATVYARAYSGALAA